MLISDKKQKVELEKKSTFDSWIFPEDDVKRKSDCIQSKKERRMETINFDDNRIMLDWLHAADFFLSYYSSLNFFFDSLVLWAACDTLPLNHIGIIATSYCLLVWTNMLSTQQRQKKKNECAYYRINCCVTFGSVSGSAHQCQVIAELLSTVIHIMSVRINWFCPLFHILNVSKLTKIIWLVTFWCWWTRFNERFEEGNAKLPVRMDVWNTQIVRQSSAELQGRLRPS